MQLGDLPWLSFYLQIALELVQDGSAARITRNVHSFCLCDRVAAVIPQGNLRNVKA